MCIHFVQGMESLYNAVLLLTFLSLSGVTAQMTSSQTCTSCDMQCVLDFITQKNSELRDEILDAIPNVRIDSESSDLSACPVGEFRPRSCWEWRQAGSTEDGIYTVYPYQQDALEVYCDMETRGGGWTVFQRRQDGSVNFNRRWSEYRDGFGDVSGEHWLGNKHIHAMTRYERNELRVELEDWIEDSRYQRYYDFYIASEERKFQLHIGSYTGSAGNALTYSNNKNFSTFDMDNDGIADWHIASNLSSGFWFGNYLRVNLNGPYHASGTVEKPNSGIFWSNFHGNSYSMKETVMKMRPDPII